GPRSCPTVGGRPLGRRARRCSSADSRGASRTKAQLAEIFLPLRRRGRPHGEIDKPMTVPSTSPAMARALIIVESPAKAKTIARFLGDRISVASGEELEPTVMSSVGHIRDLPQRASDVPEPYKGERWARLGVDVDNGFKPLYVVNPGKKDVVRDLKRKLKE